MNTSSSHMVGLSANISSTLCNGLPNPFTPMAFLAPDLAVQAQLAQFVIACSLAVLIWDQLHTLSDDYLLAFKKQFRWPTAVYFISRISTLADLVVKNVQLNSQTDHCESMRLTLCFLLAFSRASTAFLMYIRVCAVYNMNKFIVLFFGFTWLTTVAGATTTFTAMEAMYIEPTKYCTSMVKSDYLIVMSTTDFINDTSILIAIMYKLGMAGIRRSPASQLSGARTPTSRLQRFTRVFLQDSQIYYTITVVFSFATIITFFAVRTPHAPFRFTMIHPTAAIVNIMACRVFRNIKLGRYSQDIPLPAYIEGGNATQQDSKPIINGENSYHSGEMSAPKSMEFSQRKDSWRFPITGSRRLGMETPSTRFGGVEVTKVIELVRD